jgi:hypothetical protein
MDCKASGGEKIMEAPEEDRSDIFGTKEYFERAYQNQIKIVGESASMAKKRAEFIAILNTARATDTTEEPAF